MWFIKSWRYIFYTSMIKQTVNEGLHAFQQALRQNLSRFLSSQKKTHFWRGFFLKSTERQYVILKNGTRDIQTNAPFTKWHVFVRQALEILTVFGKQIFWKTKTFFKKLEYRFIVEITKIGNAKFSYKTVLSTKMDLSQKTEFC